MLSLIIPCFNEEKNLEKLFRNISLLLKDYSNEQVEILIVDNGSTDKSNEYIKDSDLYLAKKIKLIEIKNNIGYGNGIYEGIMASKGDYVAWCHADLQIDPHDVLKIFLKSKQKLLSENCVIKGKRTNRDLFDHFFTFGMSFLTFCLFQVKLNDINSQPKIFKRNFINKLKESPKDFSFDLYFLLVAKKKKFKIYEYPVVWKKRYAGEAKGGGSIGLKIKFTMRTLKFMIKLMKNQKWN
ncbi:glycosyltransferase family 2 protein [Pelagibacterales bacterium SAG-MED29]|nr:glycosyltransferase family 2 protein [Pelagibacterales bacterium SAG-MED29]